MSVALACFIVLLILKHILNGETALSVVYKYVSFGALHGTCKHEHPLLLPPCHCDVLPRRLVIFNYNQFYLSLNSSIFISTSYFRSSIGGSSMQIGKIQLEV